MRPTVPLAFVLGLLACALTVPARADEAVAIPAFEPQKRDELPPPATRGLTVLAGALTTAAWYGGGTAMSFLFPDAPGAKDLRIPVAGPWLSLRETGCASNDANCNKFTVVLRAALTAMDGLGQLSGLAIIGEGLFLPTATRTPRKAQLTLRPTAMGVPGEGVGFGVAGTF